MMGLLPLVLAVFAVMCALGSVPAAAHPVPDGAIFRGIQILVRSDRIEIRYQLGLSDPTIQEELERLAPDLVIPEDPARAVRLYRDVMFPALPEEMSITIDGQPRRMNPRRAHIIRQPHIQIELVYHVDFAAPAVPVWFVLQDDNFPEVPGYHLAALKPRGPVAVSETDAEPVLSRLARIHNPDVEAELMRLAVRRVEASIVGSEGAGDAAGQLAREVGSPMPVEPEPAAPAAEADSTDGIARVDDPPADLVGPPATAVSAAPRAKNGRAPLWIGGILIATAIVWMALVVGSGARHPGDESPHELHE